MLTAALLGTAGPASAQTPDAQALRQEIEQLRKEFAAVQQQYGERLHAFGLALIAMAAVRPLFPRA
jgi:hypothetical protein